MAQKVVTVLTDDITGKEIPDGEGATVDFAFQGYAYTIDLDAKNAKKFRETMAYYVDHARRTGRVSVAPLRRGRSDAEFDPAHVRAWAEEHGYEVSARGRIRTEVIDAYRAAQA